MSDLFARLDGETRAAVQSQGSNGMVIKSISKNGKKVVPLP